MEHLDVELVRRLIEGQLDRQTETAWRRHITKCRRCQELLAAEQAWTKVLNLGKEPASAASEGRDRFLNRIADLPLRAPTRRWPRAALTGAGLLTVVGLGVLLAWQMTRVSARPAALAQELRIPFALQNKVVANLDALVALDRDPWLAEQHDAVRTLEQLIAPRQP